MLKQAWMGICLVAMTITGVAYAHDGPTLAILKTLKFESGHVELASGVAEIDVPEQYVFLDAADAETL